jgi:general stress protein 26
MGATYEQSEAIRLLNERLQGIGTAMLTTMEPDGSLLSRPMVAQTVPFDGVLWFLARANSRLVWDVQRHTRVNLNYVAPGGGQFVAVSGVAHVVRDRMKASQLWAEPYDHWFAGGVDDPELVLIRVDVETAQAWGFIPGVTERFEALSRR